MEILVCVIHIIGLILFILGICVFGIAVLGLYRFSYVLNRLHVAAKCDTLGMLLTLSGLVLLNGIQVSSIKYIMICVFVWIGNPVVSHMIAYLQVESDMHLEEHCEVEESEKF